MLLKQSVSALASVFGLVALASGATVAQLEPIPVSITGKIVAACTSGSQGLAFEFGRVASGTASAATERRASLQINCSQGTPYSLSTASGADSSAYVVTTEGSSTVAGKVAIAVLREDASYAELGATHFMGDGSAQTVTLAARLTQGDAGHFDDTGNRVGDVTGAFSADNAHIYITY